MTKQGFDIELIVKAIQTSQTAFDVSAQALLDLKQAGVDSSVMEAMLSAQANKPSAALDALQGAENEGGDSGACNASKGCQIGRASCRERVFLRV
jgi:hypothetical protein